jgi:hypothetical protein
VERSWLRELRRDSNGRKTSTCPVLALVERKRGDEWGRGGGVRSSAREGEQGPASGSCVGAPERSTGRAVSGAVQKQGSGQCTWAAHECVGRPGEGMKWAGPKRIVPFAINPKFSNRQDLIQSKLAFS